MTTILISLGAVAATAVAAVTALGIYAETHRLPDQP